MGRLTTLSQKHPEQLLLWWQEPWEPLEKPATLHLLAISCSLFLTSSSYP